MASVKGTRFGASSTGYFWVGEGIVQLKSKITGNMVLLKQYMFGRINDDGTITTGQLSDEELQELREAYRKFEEKMNSKEMKLIFRNAKGQTKQITIDIFQNN